MLTFLAVDNDEHRRIALGEAIRDARMAAKMTQAELGRRVDTSRSTIGLLESGQTIYVQIPMLAGIAAALNRPVSEFLEQAGIPLEHSASSQIHWLTQQLDASNLRRLIAIGHALLQEQIDQPRKGSPRDTRPGR